MSEQIVEAINKALKIQTKLAKNRQEAIRMIKEVEKALTTLFKDDLKQMLENIKVEADKTAIVIAKWSIEFKYKDEFIPSSHIDPLEACEAILKELPLLVEGLEKKACELKTVNEEEEKILKRFFEVFSPLVSAANI